MKCIYEYEFEQNINQMKMYGGITQEEINQKRFEFKKALYEDIEESTIEKRTLKQTIEHFQRQGLSINRPNQTRVIR